MAITESVVKRSMIINVEDSTSGENKTKARTFNGIKADAQVDKIHSAATALGGLMEESVMSIMVNNKVKLDQSL